MSRRNITAVALLVLLALPACPASAALIGIIDNLDATGYATSGMSEQSGAGIGDAFNSNQAFNSASGNTAATATYTYSGLVSGTYDVFATWRQGGQANVQSARFAISDGGPTFDVLQTNTGPAADLILADTDGSGTLNFNFQRLTTAGNGGLVTVTDGELTITQSLAPGGNFFLADAVALDLVAARTPPVVVIDNLDAGYVGSGMTEQGSVSDAFNSNQAFNSPSGNTAATATYTATGLANGLYDVFATWRQNGQGNVQSARFAISDGGPTVDRLQTNTGPLADKVIADTDGSGTLNFNFERLTTSGLVAVTDGTLSVTQSLVPGGNFFLADAVAFEFIVPEPSSLLLTAFGLLSLGFHRRRRRKTC